jgi:AcrR family transcriptional regulator
VIRRPYHHGDLREAVLCQAMAKIESDGLAALSLRQMARECGVSPSAPQRHFATKDDLLTALAVRGYDELGALVAGLRLTGPADRALTTFARAYVGYVLEHPALVNLMYSRRFDSGAEEVQEASARAFRPIDDLLDRYRERGEIVDDPTLAGVFLRVVMRGLATSFATGALGADDTTLVRRVVDTLLTGLRPR